MKLAANFAITVDGKIAVRPGSPTGFTSPRDKRRLLEIRAEGDALLVGRNTVAADNMSMGLSAEDLRKLRRARGQAEAPLRVIISGSGNVDPDWKVFRTMGAPIILFTTERMKSTPAFPQPVTIHRMPGEHLQINDVLRRLRRDYGVRKVVCEGGPTLFRSLVEARVVTELFITIAPLIFGGEEAPTVTGLLGTFLDVDATLKLRAFERYGSECFLRYSLKYAD